MEPVYNRIINLIPAFLLGLAGGSFLNVVITRLPQEESIIFNRSRCVHCRVPLAWYDNIPLFSFVCLHGQCRSCGSPIPWRYPLVELAGGLIAGGLWARFGVDPALFLYGPFAAALVVLAGLDWEHRWIPDIISYPVMAWGLLLSLVVPQLTLVESLTGAIAGGGFLGGVSWTYYRLTGRIGLGGGDIKLLAMIGAYLGVESLPGVILMSALAGSLIGLIMAKQGGQGRLTPVPYGPFLGAAALLYLFGGEYFMTLLEKI